MSKKNKHFLSGVAVLTLASILTKVLSALYKIPFQNLTGNQGFYVYQQVYPLYGLATALSLNGLPMFISKLLAETDELYESQDLLANIFKWLVIVSGSIFLLLFLGSSWIAHIMGDAGLAEVIQSLSYIFLFVPVLASIRGYFQASLDMRPTAYSKVIEQVIRVGGLLGVAYLYTVSSWNVYQMGSYAYRSTWLSAAIASIFLLGWFVSKGSVKSKFNFKAPDLKIGQRFLSEGLEIIGISSLLVLFQFVDSFTVYRGLLARGMNHHLSMTVKGVYDRALPIVQVGTILALALVTSYLPVLRQNFVSRQKSVWEKNAVTLTRLSLVFSGAATMGLIAIFPWLNEVLFQDRAGSLAIEIYLLSVFLASLILVSHAILQSLNKKHLSLLALGIGLGIKLVLNRQAVVKFGILGSSAVTVLSLTIILLILASLLPKSLYQQIKQGAFWWKFALAIVVLGLVVRSLLMVADRLVSQPGRSTLLIIVLGAVGIGAVLFLTMAIKWNILEASDLSGLPFYSKLKKAGIL